VIIHKRSKLNLVMGEKKNRERKYRDRFPIKKGESLEIGEQGHDMKERRAQKERQTKKRETKQ